VNWNISTVQCNGRSAKIHEFLKSRGWNMAYGARLETTLGDLIVALTEETDRHVHDEKMAYEVVAYILSDLINGSPQPRGR
jgi:hypothetical protein